MVVCIVAPGRLRRKLLFSDQRMSRGVGRESWGLMSSCQVLCKSLQAGRVDQAVVSSSEGWVS